MLNALPCGLVTPKPHTQPVSLRIANRKKGRGLIVLHGNLKNNVEVDILIRLVIGSW